MKTSLPLTLLVLALSFTVGACGKTKEKADPRVGHWRLRADWPQTSFPLTLTGLDEATKKLAAETPKESWPGDPGKAHLHVWRRSGDAVYDFEILRLGIIVASGKISAAELETYAEQFRRSE